MCLVLHPLADMFDLMIRLTCLSEASGEPFI
jgi:hypothetical protein